METKTLKTNKNVAQQSFEGYEKNNYSAIEKITDMPKLKFHLPGMDKPLKYEDAEKFNKPFNVAFPYL